MKLNANWSKYKKETIENILGQQYSLESNQNSKKKNLNNVIFNIMVVLYLFIGIILIIGYFKLFDNIQFKVIGVEFLVLGIYGLLSSCVLFIQIKEKKHIWEIWICNLSIALMLPYRMFSKLLNKILKDSRQKHVAYLYPYYLISLLLTLLTAIILIYSWEIYYNISQFNNIIGLVMAFFFINEYLLLGKKFAKWLIKLEVDKVQIDEIREKSMINWYRTFKDPIHKKNRQSRFKEEWKTVELELEYTKIYFYIILTVLVLCIPKSNSNIDIILNQFMGVVTITALGREVKAKIDGKNEASSESVSR